MSHKTFRIVMSRVLKRGEMVVGRFWQKPELEVSIQLFQRSGSGFWFWYA
jgi:hypothetical protein